MGSESDAEGSKSVFQTTLAPFLLVSLLFGCDAVVPSESGQSPVLGAGFDDPPQPLPTDEPVPVGPTGTEVFDALLGRLTLQWSFISTAAVFRENVRFSVGNVQWLSDGIPFLTASDAGEWDGGFDCIAVDGDDDSEFFCIGEYSSGAVNLFQFSVRSDEFGSRRGEGQFIFCEEYIASADCVDDLTLLPSGSLIVFFDDSASVSDQSYRIDPTREYVVSDAEDWMRGLSQTTAPSYARASPAVHSNELKLLLHSIRDFGSP